MKRLFCTCHKHVTTITIGTHFAFAGMLATGLDHRFIMACAVGAARGNRLVSNHFSHLSLAKATIGINTHA